MILHHSFIKNATTRLASRALFVLATAMLLATPVRAVPGGLDASFGSGGTYSFANAQGWLGFAS